MCASRLRGAGFAYVVVLLSQFDTGGAARAQTPFLTYDFTDGNFDDFFNPTGPTAIKFCNPATVPSGEALVDSGEVLLTNDPNASFGLCLLVMRPGTVSGKFPAGPRNYKLRVKVNLETVGELLVYVRARVGVSDAADQIDSTLERGYAVGLIPQGYDNIPNGGIILVEFTRCHGAVNHPEWPGAGTLGGLQIGHVDPGIPIVQGDWYWLELTSEGNDNGGPVYVTGKVWHDGDEPPEEPQISGSDPDGLPHTAQTLDPASDVQVSFGTSLSALEPGATARIDDISLTQLRGCAAAPAQAQRTLWANRLSVEGRETVIYEAAEEYEVSLAVSSPRPAGSCSAAASITVTETVPPGWTASAPSPPGVVDGDRVRWTLALPGGAAAPLTYRVTAAAGGVVNFRGDIQEPDSDFTFVVGGESAAASVESVAPVSDFGSIQHWLILGPFTRQVGGAAPGDNELVRDYLTDGAITEFEVRPAAGDIIQPEYNGAAASTGLAPNANGRNPGDLPTWVEWRDLDDADDRVDFEDVYGGLNEVMCYAVTYLDVADDITVNFGVSSDDSVHILLDDQNLHLHNIARGALDRVYIDTPFTHPSLGNVLLTRGIHVLKVKVFEGNGEHNFRVGFLDETGVEIPGGPPGVTITLEPDFTPPGPVFRRADADGSGGLNITDGIFTLSYLFTGGSTPGCLDAADADDSGKVDISDAIVILSYLFTGGRTPPAPGPNTCGLDVGVDTFAECVYTPAGPLACGG